MRLHACSLNSCGCLQLIVCCTRKSLSLHLPLLYQRESSERIQGGRADQMQWGLHSADASEIPARTAADKPVQKPSRESPPNPTWRIQSSQCCPVPHLKNLLRLIVSYPRLFLADLGLTTLLLTPKTPFAAKQHVVTFTTNGHDKIRSEAPEEAACLHLHNQTS